MIKSGAEYCESVVKALIRALKTNQFTVGWYNGAIRVKMMETREFESVYGPYYILGDTPTPERLNELTYLEQELDHLEERLEEKRQKDVLRAQALEKLTAEERAALGF